MISERSCYIEAWINASQEYINNFKYIKLGKSYLKL